MKKIILSFGILVLLVGSSSLALSLSDQDNEITQIDTYPASTDFTHTVFAEQATSSACPYCPTAAEALQNIYQSEDYPFCYVTLVDNKNPIAKQRNLDYTFIVKIYAFPTVYFDGGDTNQVGSGGTVQATENLYRDLVEQEGERMPRQPLSVETSATWNGDAKIDVSVTITNEGNFPYFGKLRTYVTEIESRWQNSQGDPYQYALLDFAINRFVLLFPNKPKTFSGSFDGTADHQGQTYSDITQNNIQIISTVSHWIPHFRTGYEGSEYTQQYFAFFVDQTNATTLQ